MIREMTAHSDNPYRQIFQALSDEEIRYLVVGGVAVNLHGYQRYTGDIDILLALDEKNLEKMTQLMHSMGYVERFPVGLEPIVDVGQLKQRVYEGIPELRFRSDAVQYLQIGINVLLGPSLRFEEFYSRREECFTVMCRMPLSCAGDVLLFQRNRSVDREYIH